MCYEKYVPDLEGELAEEGRRMSKLKDCDVVEEGWMRSAWKFKLHALMGEQGSSSSSELKC